MKRNHVKIKIKIKFEDSNIGISYSNAYFVPTNYVHPKLWIFLIHSMSSFREVISLN